MTMNEAGRGAARDPRTRKPVATVLLMLVTCGIYYFVWYWTNITEIERLGTFGQDDRTNPKQVKRLFLVMVITFVAQVASGLSVTALAGGNTSWSDPAIQQAAARNPLLIAMSVFGTAVGILFFWKFLALLTTAQQRIGVQPARTDLLVGIYVLSSVVSILAGWAGSARTLLQVLGGVGMVTYVVLLQVALNRLWDAAPGASGLGATHGQAAPRGGDYLPGKGPQQPNVSTGKESSHREPPGAESE